MRIENVEVRVSPVGPVVLLKVRNKAIPVFVDAVVAESIQSALTGKKTPRPLTHELMRTVLEAFDGKSDAGRRHAQGAHVLRGADSGRAENAAQGVRQPVLGRDRARDTLQGPDPRATRSSSTRRG